MAVGSELTVNAIISHIHCTKCLKEIPPDMSPVEFQDIAAGFTKYGIQVWCNRHNSNIMHIDFEGIRHPASCMASLHD